MAGKQTGIKHTANGDEETTRSGLFMEAVRIIKEMRKATNGEYPRFALWENVPGAFSSNKGEDFRIVCEELIKIVEPSAFMPPVPKNGWNYADSYIGDGWSLAYRVFDAQYWGVPQRRRRIHLVADFRGGSAREVLFERQGPRGYFAEGRTPWQGTPADAQGSTGADDREGEGVFNESGRGYWMPGFGCLRAEGENRPSRPSMCIVQNATRGDRGLDAVTGADLFNASLSGDKAATLDTHCALPNGPVNVVYCLQGNGIDRADTAGCNGKGVKEDICYTLNTIDRPAVAFACNQRDEVRDVGQQATALQAQPGMKQQTFIAQPPRYIVRRLTPTECARLQGFADWWGHVEQKDSLTAEEYRFWLEARNTHAAINGKKAQDYTERQMLVWYNKLYTDSAEYKMWGNGIALPPALYCMQGITDALNADDTDDWMN